MNWGLMKGIGRGLSQGAGIVQQGLADDRAAKLQQMRDESIERRWKAEQDTREKQRTEDVSFRNEQANTSANQFDRQQTSREKQVIEANINGVMEQQNKAEQSIRKAFEKRMELGGSPELEAQLQAELEANQMYYSERLHNMINSYGSNLKGTGFEYLLTVPVKPAEEPASQSIQVKDPDEIGGLIGAITSAKPQANASAPVSQVDPQDLTLSNLLKKWGSQTALPKGRTKEMNTGFIPRQF
ncbi:MAG: hypothetical protein GW836_00580 [Paraglaciecola sp.]|nr:hypothetical protein [Paraglaciecola sp.]